MLKLIAQIRTIVGRKVKKLRNSGLIPAVLYGRGVKPLPLQVKEEEFMKIFKKAGETTLIELKIKNESGQDQESRTVLIHDFERHPTTDRFLHIDFYQVKLDEKTTAVIPLEFIGQSPAVKEQNGVLVKNIQEIEVEAFPQDLPHSVKVDISSLKTFEDNIYIKDLKVDPKVKILAGPDEVIASVVPPRVKEEEIAQPETIEEEVKTEEKKEEIQEKPEENEEQEEKEKKEEK